MRQRWGPSQPHYRSSVWRKGIAAQGWRPTIPKHAYRGRSTERLPVLLPDRLRRIVVADHRSTQGFQGAFLGLPRVGNQLQDGAPVIRDDELFAGALNLPQVLRRVVLKAGFRNGLSHEASSSSMVPPPEELQLP